MYIFNLHQSLLLNKQKKVYLYMKYLFRFQLCINWNTHLVCIENDNCQIKKNVLQKFKTCLVNNFTCRKKFILTARYILQTVVNLILLHSIRTVLFALIILHLSTQSWKRFFCIKFVLCGFQSVIEYIYIYVCLCVWEKEYVYVYVYTYMLLLKHKISQNPF